MKVEGFDFEPGPRREFIALAWQVRGGDATWVPPFRAELERLLSRDNPFFREGRARHFLARQGGRVVARCSALVPPALQHQGEPAGLVGLYEAVEAPAAGAAVLDAALGWLREGGLRQVLGPIDFSIWHGYRFMTRGFERDAFLGEPRNPAHYPEHFVAGGFAPLARWFSWELTEAHLRAMLAATRRRGTDVLAQAGLRAERLRPGRFRDELPHVHRLLQESFAQHPGYTPLGLEEFSRVFGGVEPLLVPELVPFVRTAQGETVGMGYLVPDHAAALRRMNGETGLLARLRFLLARGRPDRLVFHTVAIQQAYRRQGMLETVLADLLEDVLARGFTRGIGALAKEGPTIYSHTGAPSREYTLFHRAL
jgi:hypothetical protein